jgi:hypothetical protein
MQSDSMSCEQSLAAMSTLPSSELAGDSPVARHAATCPQCSRVAQVVLERERSLSRALDSLSSRGDPAVISETALLASERHAAGRFIRWLLVGALMVTVWFALDDTLGTRERAAAAAMRVQTIDFSCLVPSDAEKLVEPYIRSNGHGIYPAPDEFRTITIRATPQEIATARVVIAKYDGQLLARPDYQNFCRRPATAVPPAIAKP